MDVLKIPVERKLPRSQTIRVMQFAENTQFCSRPPRSLVFYARAVTAVTPRGRFNENEKLWEMPTLPISYIYFSWWQLQFTTQHSKYKRRYVKGYNSDRFAASKRDFKILVWKRFPVPERRLRLQSPRRWGRWHERALCTLWMLSEAVRGGWEASQAAYGADLLCQSHQAMAHTASRARKSCEAGKLRA